jgi:hypothetical protein
MVYMDRSLSDWITLMEGPMRRIAFRIILTITALVALSLVRVAQAREPVIITDFPLPTNRCGFPIDVEVVSNNEFEDVTTLADGTTVTKITGTLVLRFTNASTGSTIVRNVSGPSTEIDHPDGTGTFIGEGLSWFAFGPVSQGNTGEPGLVFTSGLVVLQIDSGFVTSFSLAGTQVNGCALLAP